MIILWAHADPTEEPEMTPTAPASLPASDVIAALREHGVAPASWRNEDALTLRVDLPEPDRRLVFRAANVPAGYVNVILATDAGAHLAVAALSATITGRLLAGVAAALLHADRGARVRYGRCLVTYHGRAAVARRAELLPSGFWRADLVGGLVAMYDTDPVVNRDAPQRN
jgi:hypothetical protein